MHAAREQPGWASASLGFDLLMPNQLVYWHQFHARKEFLHAKIGEQVS